MSEVYSEEDYSTGYPKGMERSFWNVARNHLIESELKTICKADDTILDFGCGTGIVTEYLRNAGLKCFGVERGKVQVDVEQSRYIFVDTDAFELPEEFRTKVKVMLLLDVLEHIEDRHSFLQKILQSYPSCEALIVTVPARMELWSNFDARWGHFLRYDLMSLESELGQADIKVEKRRYYFHLLYPPAAILALFKRQRETEFTAPKSDVLTRCVHILLGWYFIVEAKILPKKLFGTSIIVVASPVRRAIL